MFLERVIQVLHNCKTTLKNDDLLSKLWHRLHTHEDSDPGRSKINDQVAAGATVGVHVARRTVENAPVPAVIVA